MLNVGKIWDYNVYSTPLFSISYQNISPSIFDDFCCYLKKNNQLQLTKFDIMQNFSPWIDGFQNKLEK